MNIDVIRFLVQYAEGFEAIEHDIEKNRWRIKVPEGQQIRLDNFLLHKGYYPLLLQRAIEGINIHLHNKYNDQYEVEVLHRFHPIEERYLWFWNVGMDFNGADENVDKAKEQALEYIYKQETE